MFHIRKLLEYYYIFTGCQKCILWCEYNFTHTKYCYVISQLINGCQLWFRPSEHFWDAGYQDMEINACQNILNWFLGKICRHGSRIWSREECKVVSTVLVPRGFPLSSRTDLLCCISHALLTILFHWSNMTKLWQSSTDKTSCSFPNPRTIPYGMVCGGNISIWANM